MLRFILKEGQSETNNNHGDLTDGYCVQQTGEILREVSPLTRRQGVPVTAVCHDADVNFLVTGDNSESSVPWVC